MFCRCYDSSPWYFPRPVPCALIGFRSSVQSLPVKTNFTLKLSASGKSGLRSCELGIRQEFTLSPSDFIGLLKVEAAYENMVA